MRKGSFTGLDLFRDNFSGDKFSRGEFSWDFFLER